MKLLKQLHEVRQIGFDLPLSALTIFLEVASSADEVRQHELAALLDLSGAAISRNISLLDKWSWLKKPGPDLLRSEPDLMDRRLRVLRLTRKGNAFYHKLKSIEDSGVR